MPARNKSWTSAGPTGSIYRADGASIYEDSQWNSISSSGSVSDVLGNWQGDNGLVIQKYVRNPTTINGSYTYESYVARIENLVPNWYLGLKSHLPTANVVLPSLNTQIMKGTNPSRGGAFDLGVTIGELKDLPGLIRDAGNIVLGRNLPRTPSAFAKRIAGAFLQGQFGWAPMARDLTTMLDFQAAVDRRFHELKRHSQSSHGFRQRISLGTIQSSPLIRSTNAESNSMGLWRGKEVGMTVDRRWGQAIYRPTVNAGPYTDERLRQMARRAVLGIRFDAATAWELIPWSWLVDWFSNVGDVLDANRNDCGYYCDGVLIMRSLETTIGLTVTPPGPGNQGQGFKGGSGTYTTVSRYRWIQAPNFLPVIDIPILSGRQMSTLGALGIQRFR